MSSLLSCTDDALHALTQVGQHMLLALMGQAKLPNMIGRLLAALPPHGGAALLAGISAAQGDPALRLEEQQALNEVARFARLLGVERQLAPGWMQHLERCGPVAALRAVQACDTKMNSCNLTCLMKP